MAARYLLKVPRRKEEILFHLVSRPCGQTQATTYTINNEFTSTPESGECPGGKQELRHASVGVGISEVLNAVVRAGITEMKSEPQGPPHPNQNPCTQPLHA